MTNEEGFLLSQRRSIMQSHTDAGSLIDAGDTSESISVVPRVLSTSLTLNDRLFVNAIRSTVEVYDGYVKAETIPKPTKSTISSAKTKPRYKLTPEILSRKMGILTRGR
jgi:hypothetical protein